MAKAWRIISSVVIISILLGAVCVLVGKITGGDTQRVLALFNARFDITAIKAQISDAVNAALAAIPFIT